MGGVVGQSVARPDAVVSDHVALGRRFGRVGIHVPAQIRVGDHVAGHEVVAGDGRPDAGEDDPIAVRVDHVAGDRRAVGVRVELDAAVGIVIDPVAAHQRVAGLGKVDAMVLVVRRKPAAVVNAVVLDGHAPRRGGGVPPRHRDADARVVVGDLVAAQSHLVGVDPRSDAVGSAGAVELQALDRRARPLGQDLDLALEGHRVVPDRGEGDPGRLELDAGEGVGAATKATGLLRLEGADHALRGTKWPRAAAGGRVRALRRRVQVARCPRRRTDPAQIGAPFGTPIRSPTPAHRPAAPTQALPGPVRRPARGMGCEPASASPYSAWPLPSARNPRPSRLYWPAMQGPTRTRSRHR